SGLTVRQRWNAWKFRETLVEGGPSYFQTLHPSLGVPAEPVYQIPVKKTTQVPARAMNINESTAKGNADVINDLLRQGGVGSGDQGGNPFPGAPPRDLGDHVVIFHGDLATCERVQSVQSSRAAEKTPWRRLQFVVFVFGLFHLKMAAADAIWRIYLMSKSSHEDANSLMRYVAIIRPKETGKMGTNPGFRRMHQVIQHVGMVLRLDCWRVEVARRTKGKHADLESWAESKPDWKTIVDYSERMVTEYVANNDTFEDNELRPTAERDTQFENSQLRNRDFLLYEELTWTMNWGDIGAVENCFLPSIMIFKATAKHKYASQMTKLLFNLHFVYPPRLSRAIRLNWLCNPTGKPGKFRAVDWLVERNNLYTKSIYGGKYSNHTVSRIIAESAIIETYRGCIDNMESNFQLTNRTVVHTDPSMTQTRSKLAGYVKEHSPHEQKPGRKVKHVIENNMSLG
ncbi:hypothetical protein FA95DRAFT_1469453, partial [Auriscalpium vulgare]